MPLKTPTTERARHLRDAHLWQDLCLADLVNRNRARAASSAVSDRYGTLTHGDLRSAVSHVASWLAGTTRARDVVALQTRGSADVLVLHLACSQSDRIAMPMSHSFTEEETDHLLKLSGATVFIQADPGDLKSPRSAAELHDRHAGLVLVGSENGAADADFDFRDVVAGKTDSLSDVGPSEADAAHLAMISSGTTQMPKASLWTDNDLWFLLSQYAARVNLTREDVALQVAPANTGSTGYVFPVLAPALFGARSVMPSKWSPELALEAIAEQRVTVATAVPTQMVKMVQAQQRSPRDVTSLRVFNNAGAKLEEAHARRVEETFNCRVQASYGASDGGVPVLTSVNDDDHHRLRSVGRALPGVDLRLIDPDGRPVTDPGATGEIRWRTPSKTFGYLNNPDQDDQAFDENGYYASGDLGVVDEEGYLFVVGRSRDMIIRGGQNIHPGEIEEAVLTHPAVAEAAAVGLSDEVYGERTAVVVVMTQPAERLNLGLDLDLDELCDWLRSRGLATHKLPERIEILDELPRNTGGKVDKIALKALLRDGHG